MRRYLFPSVIGIVGFAIGVILGLVAGWMASGMFGERAIDRTIAMSWGDGKNGKQFYGAQVYVVPAGTEYSVRARVLIGPGNGYWHDCEEIGRASSVEESVNQWGTIRWHKAGLDIGDPAKGGYHLPRKRFESHR